MVRRRQVMSVRRIIQQLPAQFGQLLLHQFGDMQLCATLKQNKTAATSTRQGPIAAAQVFTAVLGVGLSDWQQVSVNRPDPFPKDSEHSFWRESISTWS
ncbi:hypothetical protein KIN20_006267 [Parelaphostrongylus tenuis]|uniref:Uncharacterized protein n=1 Tax=Parelaphostrongylus tenuis TaxID=148309 RepID=A0AAD5QKU6_PARTN|nr:hypothetical protein KIN20_006267 [Parelaphostrongylus tenuis]